MAGRPSDPFVWAVGAVFLVILAYAFSQLWPVFYVSLGSSSGVTGTFYYAPELVILCAAAAAFCAYRYGRLRVTQ